MHARTCILLVVRHQPYSPSQFPPLTGLLTHSPTEFDFVLGHLSPQPQVVTLAQSPFPCLLLNCGVKVNLD